MTAQGGEGLQLAISLQLTTFLTLAIKADKLNVTKGRNNAAAKLTANIKKITTMFVYQNLTIRECIITLLIIYIIS